MTQPEDFGKLILRLTLGVLILLHGIAKIGTGIGFVANLLQGHGLPAELAYIVYVGEIVAPALIIVGLTTRLAATIVAISMAAAFWLVHMNELTQLDKTGGWALELQGMYLFGALSLAFLGAGRLSLGGINGRFN